METSCPDSQPTLCPQYPMVSIKDKKVKSSFYVLIVGFRQASSQILIYTLNQNVNLETVKKEKGSPRL